MNLAKSGTMGTDMKMQYICTLFCGIVLHKFDLMSAGAEGTNPLIVEANFSGLTA